ncbi:MAG: hypothetical protein MHMPM18_000264 [Marteilia pararefringens]
MSGPPKGIEHGAEVSKCEKGAAIASLVMSCPASVFILSFPGIESPTTAYLFLALNLAYIGMLIATVICLFFKRTDPKSPTSTKKAKVSPHDQNKKTKGCQSCVTKVKSSLPIVVSIFSGLLALMILLATRILGLIIIAPIIVVIVLVIRRKRIDGANPNSILGASSSGFSQSQSTLIPTSSTGEKPEDNLNVQVDGNRTESLCPNSSLTEACKQTDSSIIPSTGRGTIQTSNGNSIIGPRIAQVPGNISIHIVNHTEGTKKDSDL